MLFECFRFYHQLSLRIYLLIKSLMGLNKSLLDGICTWTYFHFRLQKNDTVAPSDRSSFELQRNNGHTLNRTLPQQLENGLPPSFHWTLYLTFILLFIYQGEHSCVTFCYPLRQVWRQWFHCSISSCSVSAQQNMTEQMNQLSVPVAVPSQGEAKEVRRPD